MYNNNLDKIQIFDFDIVTQNSIFILKFVLLHYI
jgi:hypothetical protein